MRPRPTGFDLNALAPSFPGKPQFDWSRRDRSTAHGTITAHFGDIATPLAQFLRDSESIVGCVAWITSPKLVDAMLGKPVSLIMNKEWALRSTDAKPASVRMRQNLARLTGGLRRRDFPAPLNQIPGTPNDTIDAVRCVGHNLRARTANSPLMHHKFVVRLTHGKPTAVWCGSFNFTVNAESSLEFGLLITDRQIAAAFLDEYARVAALSEPLDFAAGKADPTWTAARRTPAKSTKAAKPPVKKPAAAKPPVKKLAPPSKASAARRKPSPRKKR